MGLVVILLCCAEDAKGANLLFETVFFLVTTKISPKAEFEDLFDLGNCNLQGSQKQFEHSGVDHCW